jgi:ADP-ribose pyrophosphatase YjhB (NUDIX family)
MLPASHMLFQESPLEAARRILREQLELGKQKLEGPLVFSEVYGPQSHWDLHFIFLGETGEVVPALAWRDLEFVDLRKVRKEQMARSHEDILALVGKWKVAP